MQTEDGGLGPPVKGVDAGLSVGHIHWFYVSGLISASVSDGSCCLWMR